MSALHPPAHRRRADAGALRLLSVMMEPVRVVDIAAVVRGEADENVLRKAFLPTEAAAIALAVEEEERELARERQEEGRRKGGGDRRSDRAKQERSVATCDKAIRAEKPRPPKSEDKAARAAGVSAGTLRKIKAVVESGDRNLIAKMDRSGKADGAYKAMMPASR